ncbi:ferritin-like fold-containing protein [Leekyejoonella antrihumi]|uniref:Hydroxylase n=1 Tax=Leekyejoonella antrihumi TaxID=1660198 RepID=A0A563DVJ8_9MICO|nr:ferritin-like fold-containing protein [Leekyejoonella antrihumi]TWP33744.1 hydroxylase [Leekyejoonella antrihumi]
MPDDATSNPHPVTVRSRTEADLQDPVFRRGVVALLGALAYGELVSFFTIVHDADTAPQPRDKVALARVAVHEFDHYERLVARLKELGVDPQETMAPFAKAIDTWHHRIQSSSWLEGLMKVYAGNSIATDFYRECAALVDPPTRSLVEEVLKDSGQTEFAKAELTKAIVADGTVAGRLALWGRRLVGEALSQAQRVAAEQDELTSLLIDDGSGHGFDLGELMRLFTRITDAHTARMEALGLTA